MPANDAYLANLRADGHKLRLYYGKFDGAVVLNASVSATPADQALDLSITVNSGSASDVRRGFLARVESAGGVLRGITNLRAAGTISATNLPIRELGQADIPIVSGDIVKVYNLPYLGDKIPTDDASFAPDNLTYVDQGTAVPPRVNSGGHFIGMVDSGQSYATIPLPGVSTAEDPDSGGTITHLWTLLTGTLTFAPGSASTDANPTLRASVGYGLAEHTVTDSSNSKAWTQYVCTQVYNDANPPYRLIDAELSADEANGWSGNVQTYAYSGLSDLYDGQFVGVFARETINGVTVSYGSDIPNRSHIKLIGFLSRDENELDPQIRRVHLSLQSPWQRLSSLPGFSKVFTRVEADWTLISGLTVRLALLHLIRYYSFFMEFFDLRIDADFLNKAWSKYYLNKTTADQQIRELADGVDARVVSLRTGEMLVHTHPCLIPLASRAAVTTTLTIAERDCLSAPFTRDHWKPIETFELRGFIAGAADNATVFSRYPGLAPGRGAQSLAAERIIADSQSDANARCGRRAARADGVFFNSSNAYARAVEWDVTLPGSYDLFDFNKEYVQTGLTGGSNLRGVDLSAQNYYLSRIRISYIGGTARVNPTFLTATNAPAGATYVPAEEDLPPYTPPDDVPMPNPIHIPPLGIGVNTLAAVNNDGYTYLFANWQGTPVVTRYSLTALGMQGTLLMFVVDAFSPLYLGTGTEVNGVLITTSHAYRLLNIGNIGGAASLANEYAFRYAPNYRSMQSERGLQGFFAVVSHDNFGTLGTDIEVTLDAGITWTRYAAVFPSYGGQNNYDGCYVSARVPGKIITSGSISGAALAQLKLVTAYGATQAALDANLLDLIAGDIHIPFQDAAESTIYHGGTIAGVFYTWKTVNGVRSDISPIYLSVPWGVSEPFSLKTCDIDANHLLVCARSASANEYAVFLSANAGASYSALAEGLAAAMPYRSATFAGNSPNYSFHWGNSGAMGVCTDGATIEDKRGNLPTDFPSAGRFWNIVGVG